MRRRSPSWIWVAPTAALLSCSSAPPPGTQAAAPRADAAPRALAAPEAPRDPAASLGDAPSKGLETSEAAGAAGAKQATKDDVGPPDRRPRIAAIDQFVYIWKKPARDTLALGYVRMGTSVPLLSDQPVAGENCARGFYAVAPRGYVCLDRRTTLDLDDPYFRALQSVGPDPDAVWPYHYAFSNGAPMYSRIPTPAEQKKREIKLGPPGSFVQLAEWSAGHEELIVADPIKATEPVPAMFAGGKRQVGSGARNPEMLVWRTIPNGSMVAYSKAFEAQGRVWLLTSDLMLVPADRVRAIRRSTFHGVDLGHGVELPLAWNRAKSPKPKYRRDAGGAFVVTDATLAAKTPVPIGSERFLDGKRAFYEVRGEAGVYIAEADVTIARARATLPKGVSEGEKWIEAKILPGTMTAYVGMRPVRSSLFSPGKGGAPVAGHDHTKYATTQTGYFPIEWKDRVATMSNEKSEPKILWFSDVPNIQYLKAPLAMHVSYWHEDYGNPKSAECVNVSPEDGRWLFEWTEPHVPEGWGGMRPGDGNGKSTPVVITAQ